MSRGAREAAIKRLSDNRRDAEERSEFERYEAKYVIDRSLVPEIREFIRPFCVPDPNAEGSPPEYLVTTLQLDSPTLALHYAKEREAQNRFKLRVRTYRAGAPETLYLEIKRKIQGFVLKSRAVIPASCWGRDLFRRPASEVPFRSRHEMLNFAEYARLVERLCAAPVMAIRYVRESYLSRADAYARVTFDRRLCCCPARSWAFPGPETRWRAMDSATAMNRPFSGLILELKTYRDAPQWMVEMTERFSLVRTGFSKYSTAMRLESLFEGGAYSDQSENCTYGTLGM